MLTAFAVSVFAPMTVMAAKEDIDMSQYDRDVTLSADECGTDGSCIHFIYGKSKGGGIVVESGTHKIVLGASESGTVTSAEIDFSDSAMANQEKVHL